MFDDQATTDDWKNELLAHINIRLKRVCIMPSILCSTVYLGFCVLNFASSHHMEKTEASHEGLCIREITLKYNSLICKIIIF